MQFWLFSVSTAFHIAQLFTHRIGHRSSDDIVYIVEELSRRHQWLQGLSLHPVSRSASYLPSELSERAIIRASNK